MASKEEGFMPGKKTFTISLTAIALIMLSAMGYLDYESLRQILDVLLFGGLMGIRVAMKK